MNSVDMLELRQQQKKLRVWGILMIIIGNAILIPSILYEFIPGLLGSQINLVGVIMIARSFLHSKYAVLKKQKYQQKKSKPAVSPLNPVPSVFADTNESSYQRDVKREFLQRQIEKLKNGTHKSILFSNISGTGPYHEETRLWIEKINDTTYQIFHTEIAPMAGAFSHTYTFTLPMSLSDFVSGFYKELPYVKHVYKEEQAEDLYHTLNSENNMFKNISEQIAAYERLLAEYEKKEEKEFLDDTTFIREIKHIFSEPWQQYDILLAARGYGWETMKDWADYMATADLEHISQVTVSSLGAQERVITESYSSNGCKCRNTPELNAEMGMLSIAGMSKTLKAPLKIVWINQTQVLRFFTLVDDELLIKKYAETTIRRTFGTVNAMKLGKPIPDGQ